MITRRHFLPHYKAGCAGAPPPLHVVHCVPEANHWPLPRPLQGGAQPGPQLVLGGGAEACLGIDPTDPSTWEGRGYSHSPGMIGWLNVPPGVPPMGMSGEAVPRGSL
jgi:hypothetical protein